VEDDGDEIGKLTERAQREGVSLNTLAVALLAEGLGAKEAPPPLSSGKRGWGEGRLRNARNRRKPVIPDS
jgi:hypothetical protein